MDIPRFVFFTKGVGIHKDKLNAFELALRVAGIAPYNLVKVSSILPPRCRIISKEKGLEMLSHGQLLPVVLARISTNKPGERISAAIGIAKPKTTDKFGYIAEYSSNEPFKVVKKNVTQLAVNLLSSASGVRYSFEAKKNVEVKSIAKQSFANFSKSLILKSMVQSAKGHKNRWWTTAIAAAVLI